MKHFNIVSIGLLTLLLSSCGDYINGHRMGDRMSYSLSFHFQDSEGNDLSKGVDHGEILVNSDYKLDIILSKQSELWDNKIYQPVNEDPSVIYDDHSPKLVYLDLNGQAYIGNQFTLYTGLVDHQKILTYQITCPYIFGDDDVHFLTTYWRDLGEKYNTEYFVECYKVEFEGQVITDIGHIKEGFNLLYMSNYITLTISK